VKQSLSKSILIRSAIPGDEIAVARVHVRAWQVGYQGLLSDAYLTGLRAEDRAKRYTFGDASESRPKTLIATESGVIVGFATISPAQDDERTSPAELNALYVDPDCWKRGIGSALESAAQASLVQLGYRHAMLWVLAGNVRAIRFYQSQGWGSDGTSRQADVWGITVTEIRFARSLDLSATAAPVGG
jgi:ribosomal protein S18 acetylase RimI-like enzyme